MDEEKRECVGIFIRKTEKEERGRRSRGDTDPGKIRKQSQDRVKWGRKQDRVRSGRGWGRRGSRVGDGGVLPERGGQGFKGQSDFRAT